MFNNLFAPKIKIEKHHKKLIQALADEFGFSYEEMALGIFEKSWTFLGMCSHEDEKIMKGIRMFQNDELWGKIIKRFREYWEEGKGMCADENCNCKK